jgi:hypothetical protein
MIIKALNQLLLQMEIYIILAKPPVALLAFGINTVTEMNRDRHTPMSRTK